MVATLFWKASSLAAAAPLSSIDTQRFIANDLSVIERSSAMTSFIAPGSKPCGQIIPDRRN